MKSTHTQKSIKDNGFGMKMNLISWILLKHNNDVYNIIHSLTRLAAPHSWNSKVFSRTPFSIHFNPLLGWSIWKIIGVDTYMNVNNRLPSLFTIKFMNWLRIQQAGKLFIRLYFLLLYTHIGSPAMNPFLYGIELKF